MGPLSTRGAADAERLGMALAGIDVAAIYSSPFRRAHDTVQPLANKLGLPIQAVADLRERRLGDGPFPDFVGAVRATWDDFSFAHAGGESNAAAQSRMVSAHRRLLAIHPERCILLATHGNVLALLLNHYDRSIGFDFWKGLSRPDVYRLWTGPRNHGRFERIGV